MKTLNLLIVSLFLPCLLFSQTLTGLWMGSLVNDSNGKRQDYELALSEYRGKVTGYSYTTFFEDDRYYYSVKRIKAERKEDEWIISDDKMIANNFPEKAAKGVKQITTFTLNQQDSTWHMNGTWKTTQTKVYYSLSGQLEMKAEKDHGRSNLFSHLGDLDLDETVSFYTPDKRLLSMGKFRVEKTTNVRQPLNEELKTTAAVTVSSATPAGLEGVALNATTTESSPLQMRGRTIHFSETIYFTSDSISLAIYDNGEIDGDTVSVYLDGQVLLSNEGLKASALKTSLQPKAGQEEMQLVLVAENLGKYPPNTGLLVVRDGDAMYQIRFSADLQNSPGIIFRRKKP